MAVAPGSFYMARLAQQQRRPAARAAAPSTPYAPAPATAPQYDTGAYYGGYSGGGQETYGGMPDAYYQQMASQLRAQGVADQSATRAAIQQALIGFGLVPEGFKDQLGALDDTTRALIQKNTDTGISGYARLLQAAKDAQTGAITKLGAQGLRRSGAKGYKLRRLQLAKDQAQQDAIAALLGDVGGKYSAYAQNEGNRQMQLLQNLFQSQYRPFSGPTSFAPPQAPTMSRQQAANYWTSNPGPTGYLPSGRAWYGGTNGLEASPFPGKAYDSLVG